MADIEQYQYFKFHFCEKDYFYLSCLFDHLSIIITLYELQNKYGNLTVNKHVH